SHVSCGHSKHFLKICKHVFAFSTGKTQCLARRRASVPTRARHRATRRAMRHRSSLHRKMQNQSVKQAFFDVAEKKFHGDENESAARRNAARCASNAI